MNRIRQYMRSSWQFAISVCIVVFLGFISIFAPFIANDTPILLISEAGVEWPLFGELWTGRSDDTSYRSLEEGNRAVFPLIPYSTRSNLQQRYSPPGSIDRDGDTSTRHWLGDRSIRQGRSSRYYLWLSQFSFIALLAMVFSMLVGICIGGLAGYFGNREVRISIVTLVLTCIGVVYLIFLSVHHLLTVGLFLILLLVYIVIVYAVHQTVQLPWKISVPIDALVLRMIEIMQSLPGLLILLVIASLISRPTFFGLAVIIGLLRWPGVAKYIRAEVQKTSAEDYILAARISGLRHLKILLKYVLPRTVAPLVVIFSFGFASVVLLESTLSFLGIGVPIDDMTLGNLLGQTRERPQAWWLALFRAA